MYGNAWLANSYYNRWSSTGDWHSDNDDNDEYCRYDSCLRLIFI